MAACGSYGCASKPEDAAGRSHVAYYRLTPGIGSDQKSGSFL